MSHSEANTAERLKRIQEAIQEAAIDSGRTMETIQLIAVSKTHPISAIQEAYEAGQLCFGENRMQEALEKIPQLPEALEWHFIGHLQKNKARHCPGNFQWIHSIDSLGLVKRLEQQCALKEVSLNGLLQVNLSQEQSKSGLGSWESLVEVAEAMLPFQWLKLRGLMTIAKPGEGELATRKLFAQLREWQERLREHVGATECTELSMGMSSDYQWAVQEGATMIRIGTAIFGQRKD